MYVTVYINWVWDIFKVISMRNVYNYDVSVVMFLYELYQRNNDFTDGRVRPINVIGSSCDDRKAHFSQDVLICFLTRAVLVLLLYPVLLGCIPQIEC